MSTSIQSVERALEVLTLISENSGPMGISEIARILKAQKSTIHRTVYTLCKKGFLDKDENSDQYILGKSTYNLGFKAPDNLPIAKTAKPYMAFLSEKYQEPIGLTLFYDGNAIEFTYYLGNFSSTFYNLHNLSGISMPYRPSIVYTMLAYQSTLEANDPLIIGYRGGPKQRGPHSVEDLIVELKKVRERGYSVEHGDYHPSEICFSTPIFSLPVEPGRAIATLSLLTSEDILKKFTEEEIIKDMKYVSEQITNSDNSLITNSDLI